MKIDLKSLIAIQEEVDGVVAEKSAERIPSEKIILAFNIEFFEYFNEIGIWKWWKHSHQIKRDRVLDELADCFAFFLKLVGNFKVSRGEGYMNWVGLLEEDIEKALEAYSAFCEEEGWTDNDAVINLITVVGAENESEELRSMPTMDRFILAIFLATKIFKGITWEEITDAYKKKSAENIERQKRNY